MSSSTQNHNGSLRQRQGNGRAAAHDHEDDHTHSHSHSIFGHSHSHGDHGHSHAQDAEKIIAALKGSGDRGSQITLVGLFANIGLTATKGVAGWYLHSASLLADAGHSLSDLLGDFVTLFCWRLSRKPSSQRYPYGFAKFETLGTTTISILLIGGALGIGFHSYHLLMVALADSAAHLSPGPLQEILQAVSSAPVPQIGHVHAHGVDPNAAWFAAVSVVAKEWLYRITKTVADEERSPVLLANAIHHRSDAYSSLVAFFAIVGTWLFPAFPLDPIGGLVVSLVILRQGYELLKGAWGDLTDASVSPRTHASIEKILQPLITKESPATVAHSSKPTILDISHLRARQAGSTIFVDLTAVVPGSITVDQAHALDARIQELVKEKKKEVAEVRVKFEPWHSSH
ncbi:mitochondrial iron ion transporter [Coprinopsis cinerea okayama7|uniref:Mitochondrial iron ion transporter n=1 Tax=Coprinopsis cinerea (strain Okayama-7 / 130 / ATCC MYA-4618 / FGSC 9003) TaxID=240176 RepID=A8N6W7_COPC7|nr:mitochondrial iron ion transporter [Coprinopsis cinerea okayama7\|eukprot:XP_001830573.2 mitochondrial iron ion transporter [Coprinopsis cinerea okayama7\